VVGINTFGSCPLQIARYLELDDPEKYTGHAFRRTSATIMANSGMTIDQIQRQVGWKSAAVATGYVEESIRRMFQTSLGAPLVEVEPH
jgi:integrase